MSYDVGFKAKLEGVEQWVYVGDDGINFTSNTAAMIKEVCGSYPREWDGENAGALGQAILRGAFKLMADPERYRHFEPPNRWGTVESTSDFLTQVATNCIKYPTAIIEVDY